MGRWERWRRGLLVAVAAAAVVWQLRPVLWPKYHMIFLESHDGRSVTEPWCVLPSPTGGPPDFAPEDWLPMIRIPSELAEDGREMLLSGRGCGLLRTVFDGACCIEMPPPIRVTVRVPGTFPLPRGDHGLSLTFHAAGVDDAMAALLDRAPAAADYWDAPDPPLWPAIWIDPVTRSADVLLPCPGDWRVEWSHTDRPSPSIAIVYGYGEAPLTVTRDGEQLTLEIDPAKVDADGWGLGGDPPAAAPKEK